MRIVFANVMRDGRELIVVSDYVRRTAMATDLATYNRMRAMELANASADGAERAAIVRSPLLIAFSANNVYLESDSSEHIETFNSPTSDKSDKTIFIAVFAAVGGILVLLIAVAIFMKIRRRNDL